MYRGLILTALGLAAAIPVGLAAADNETDKKEAEKAAPAQTVPAQNDNQTTQDDCPVWVAGHYERRETRCPLPAVVRKVWVPEKCEPVFTPAVTERVLVPAVTEQIWCPRVVERNRIPEVRERTWCPGRWDTVKRDDCNCETRVFVAGHYEVRIVKPASVEEKVVSEGHFETRVITPERYETRIVTPEKRDWRVVEAGHYKEITVKPARTEVTVTRTWVPGHWEGTAAAAKSDQTETAGR